MALVKAAEVEAQPMQVCVCVAAMVSSSTSSGGGVLRPYVEQLSSS